jgi:hypothetical protein
MVLRRQTAKRFLGEHGTDWTGLDSVYAELTVPRSTYRLNRRRAQTRLAGS